MQRSRRLLATIVTVCTLTFGMATYDQQSANADNPAVTAIAVPSAAPAAPEAALPAVPPVVAPEKGEGDTGADSTSDGKADSTDTDPNQVDVGGATVSFIKSLVAKEWVAALASLFLIVAYGFSRKTWLKKVPLVGDWLATDDFGGLVGAFIAAFLVALGTAGLTEPSMMFTSGVLVLALKIGVFAVGGYSGIWKKLPFVKSSTTSGGSSAPSPA